MSTLLRRIALPEIKDARGSLMFAEEGRHVPFPIKRMFAIYGVRAGEKRGGHAHRAQHQFLFMLAGACTVLLDDGRETAQARLTSPSEGLHVPPGIWLELRDFSADAICVVLSSGVYDEADYVRDRAEFLRLK